MALINIQQREIHCKLVYYGPVYAGKMTCMHYIWLKTLQERRSELLSIATEYERTVFFNLLDPDDSTVKGFRIRLYIYAAPGPTLYERTRTAMLPGTDGVIFVADARKKMLEENVASIRELARNLAQQDKKLHTFPFVLQYHKRDVPDAMPVDVLDRYLRPLPWPRFESYAHVAWDGASWQAGAGSGVLEALRALVRMVVAKL